MPSYLRREGRPGAFRGAQRRLPRALAPLAGALAAAALLLTPSLASADSSSQLTVVGTSDVSDSGLIPNLIQPGFSTAYPQFTFKYVGTASGTAITDAETGVNTPSVLIVHAPSLENQFVAGGFSYEPYGRAIWTNDFILAGSTADPAGVGANASHNIAQAFADIANDGANPGANGAAYFVSRENTSGTTVSEHGIWGLVYNDGLTPPNVDLCQLPQTSPAGVAIGGGYTPISTNGATNGEACPGGVLPGTAGGGTAPSWYIGTGLTQGPNIVAANACSTAPETGNDCYVYTDRGTYDYELAGASPSGGANQVPNLSILTRNNSASAPGGVNELENYFHAYIINPAKSPTPVNLTAAQDFINYITSPAVQSSLSGYLSHTSDPGGAPFVADASPAITASGLPSTVAGGAPVTVTGTVTNQEPNYAVPANQTVTVDEVIGGVPVAVASGTTNSAGAYSITFTPPSSGTYQVATGLISLIENASLSPAFGDLLSPGASASKAITVTGSATLTRVTTKAGGVTAAGSILPVAPDANATVTLMGRRSVNGPLTPITTAKLVKGATTYAVNGKLKGGRWTIAVEYSDGTGFTSATTATQKVTVPFRAVSATFGKVTLRGNRLLVRGKLDQAPTTGGAQVRLLVATLGKVSAGKKAKAVSPQRKTKKKRFHVKRVATVKLKKGHATYTVRAKLKRGYRYVIQLQYHHKGQKTTYSSYRHLTVR